MTNTQSKVPQLRFPEFNDAWSVVRLSEVTEYIKGFAFKSQDYQSEGTRIVRVSDLGASAIKKQSKNVYIDSSRRKEFSNHEIHEGDIIVTTVGSRPELLDSAVGRAIYIDSENQGLLNQNLLMLKKTEVISNRILYSQLNTARYVTHITLNQRGNANQSNITVKDLLAYKVSKPLNGDESLKLSSFLSTVEKKISLLKQKYEQLAQYKKGIMQQLFSQKLRFKGNEGQDFPDWKSVQLKSILLLQNNPIDMQDDKEYELITAKRRNGGIVSRGKYLGKEVLVKSQFKLKGNQFVISKRQIVHGACGLVPKHLEGAILSNEYNVFEGAPDVLDIHYFNLFSKTLEMKKAYFRSSDGVHIEKLLFRTKDWLKTRVKLPSLDEQKRIVSFSIELEKKISLIQQQIEQTQAYKQGLLQQMFV